MRCDRTGQILGELCKRFLVVSVSRNDPADQVEEVIYEIELKSGVTYAKLVQRLNQVVAPLSINILVGEGNVNV